MAIDYSAGFLPQTLYSNMMQTQREGLAEANQRERERYNQLGQLGAAFVKGNINMGDKAQEAYTKNYDIQRKRLTDTMAKLDPRSGDYENYKNAIANLDSEYTNKMQAFQESGFLGSLGRDRDMLSGLTNYEPGSYSPDSTAAAYALTDDQTKYQNKMNTDLEMKPKIAGAEDTAKLNATAQWTASPEGQQYYETLQGRELEQKKEEAKIEVKKALEIQGGSNLDLIKARGKIDQMNGAQLRQLDLQLAQFQLDAAKQRHQMGMARDEKQHDLKTIRDQSLHDATIKEIEARTNGGNKKSDKMTFSQYSSAKNAIINGYKKDLGLLTKIQTGELTESDLDAMADQEVRARYQQFQNFNNPTGGANETGEQAAPASTTRTPEQPTAPVAAPSAADLGFTPPPGRGFISPNNMQMLETQISDIANRVDALKKKDGTSMFPDLQKRSDQLMVRADQFYKKLAAAKTPEEQNDLKREINALGKEINTLAIEMDTREKNEFGGGLRGDIGRYIDRLFR